MLMDDVGNENNQDGDFGLDGRIILLGGENLTLKELAPP